MRGATRTATARTVNSTSAVDGIAAGLLIYGAIELIGWGYCSFQQLITTHDSIVSILQGGVLIPSTMTPQQLLSFLQTNMDKYNKIAWTVAIVTQIIYWGAALPGSPIKNNKLLYWLISGGFFMLEVITDMWYSLATGTTLGGAFTYVFNWGNGGWLVSLCYIAAMSAGSIFLGIRGLHHVSKALAPVFRQMQQQEA
jgi:hypothetical protein